MLAKRENPVLIPGFLFIAWYDGSTSPTPEWKSGKLFKTPIFERWGEAVLFKLRTPDLTLKSVDSSHER